MRYGKIKVVHCLLVEGAEVNAENFLFETPLHCAVKDKKIEFVQYLIGKGADVRAKNY